MPAERNPTKAEQAKYRRERKAAGICPKCDGKGSPSTWCPRCHNTGREPKPKRKVNRKPYDINVTGSKRRACPRCGRRGTILNIEGSIHHRALAICLDTQACARAKRKL